MIIHSTYILSHYEFEQSRITDEMTNEANAYVIPYKTVVLSLPLWRKYIYLHENRIK